MRCLDPVITNLPAVAYLKENEDGSSTPISLFTVTATDADSDTIYFSFNTPVTDFSINVLSGAVTYSGSGISAAATATVTLNVLLFDSSGSSGGPATLKVDIDQAPRSQSDPNNAFP